ncbi:MAG: hypothetical protein HRT68_13215 [Flavobacteriaceae bacterium]|nr:hypothetical protein [Flavobacteriaceae bacterium]
MKQYLKGVLEKGKYQETKNNKRNNKIICLFVILGCLSGLVAFPFFDRTFIKYSDVVFIGMFPSLILLPLLYKRLVRISGYKLFIKNNWVYNMSLPIIIYTMIGLSLGAPSTLGYLWYNEFASSKHETTVNLEMKEYFKVKRLANVYVSYNGLKKRFKMGADFTEQESKDKLMQLKIAEGFFGYPVIKSRKVLLKESE